MAGMRVTGAMVVRRYTNHLNRNFEKKNLSEQKIISQRKFTRASQSPIEAVKALKVRKAMAEIDTYQKNLETAAGIYDSAENAVRQVSGILQTIQEKLIQAAHGTYDVATDKQIIGREVDECASEITRLMNLIVADRRIFGGVNDTEQAYRIENGTAYYLGEPVNRYQDATLFRDAKTSFLDAGLGMAWLDDYTIDPQTAVPVTFNGAEILGCGLGGHRYSMNLDTLATAAATATAPTTYSLTMTLGETRANVDFTINPGDTQADIISSINAAIIASPIGPSVQIGAGGIFGNSSSLNLSVIDNPDMAAQSIVNDIPQGYPNNIIQLTLDAAKSCRAGTDEETARYADLLFAAQSSLSLSIASIGSEQKFIEFNQERLQNNMLSLEEQQNEIEFVNLGEESTNWKLLEMVYNATLQMSTSTIPNSIFNFMR